MRILLDLDGIVLINGQLHPRFYEFQSLVKRDKHGVTIWSSHDDGKAIASLMGFNHLHKDSSDKPVADVLIDDYCEDFSRLCVVSITYNSLDDFLGEEGEANDYDDREGFLIAALAEITQLGANPITKHGCTSRADFMRLVDKMYLIAFDALRYDFNKE